jgi:hypothetical protein
VSSGNKEGLRARIEGVERVEAADEGLRGTRGMERESDVECIQSPSSWEASVDADSGRPSTFFPFTLAWTRPLPQSASGRLCDKLPHHKTRPLEATARLVPSTYNAAQSLHHVLSTHPFECWARDKWALRRYLTMSSISFTLECPVCLDTLRDPIVPPCGKHRPILTHSNVDPLILCVD